MARTEKEQSVRDSKRAIGPELLQAILDVEANEVLATPARTLQHWEQGRRQPSLSAATHQKIIARHPELLFETITCRCGIAPATNLVGVLGAVQEYQSVRWSVQRRRQEGAECQPAGAHTSSSACAYSANKAT